jgi:hypothetical protein
MRKTPAVVVLDVQPWDELLHSVILEYRYIEKGWKGYATKSRQVEVVTKGANNVKRLPMYFCEFSVSTGSLIVTGCYLRPATRGLPIGIYIG